MIIDRVIFFAKADSGILVFFTMAMLLQNTLQGPTIGIPKHLSLMRKADTKSLAIRMATSSDL